jgi:single-strand DNA-binding protein
VSLPQVHGEFRIGADPELRFAPSGVAVCKARAVASSRKKTEGGEWVDDKTCWVYLVGFKRMAENMAESLEKGHLVTVIGKVSTDEWEDREGNKRTSINVVVDSIGPAITWDPARVMKGERQQGGGGGQQQQSSPQEDPWATGPSSEPQAEEPPF